MDCAQFRVFVTYFSNKQTNKKRKKKCLQKTFCRSFFKMSYQPPFTQIFTSCYNHLETDEHDGNKFPNLKARYRSLYQFWPSLLAGKKYKIQRFVFLFHMPIALNKRIIFSTYHSSVDNKCDFYVFCDLADVPFCTREFVKWIIRAFRF